MRTHEVLLQHYAYASESRKRKERMRKHTLFIKLYAHNRSCRKFSGSIEPMTLNEIRQRGEKKARGTLPYCSFCAAVQYTSTNSRHGSSLQPRHRHARNTITHAQSAVASCMDTEKASSFSPPYLAETTCRGQEKKTTNKQGAEGQTFLVRKNILSSSD
jgi:hypothetical protein